MRAKRGHRQVFGHGSLVCRLILLLALALAPHGMTASHGPADYARAIAALAADHAHGHSHDFDGSGSGAHNVFDHDHQTYALILHSGDDAPIAAPAALLMDATSAEGRARDRLRRPPRTAA